MRQLLTESVVLAFLGGAAAIAVAWWGSRTMFAMVAEGSSATRLDLAPDGRSFAFTAAVALLTAILFELAPALSVVTIAGVFALIAATALVAASAPARRASGVDPLRALRYE